MVGACPTQRSSWPRHSRNTTTLFEGSVSTRDTMPRRDQRPEQAALHGRSRRLRVGASGAAGTLAEACVPAETGLSVVDANICS